jgi:hypothetical protein
MINQYGPAIKEVERKSFITLSCKNVKGEELRGEIGRLLHTFGLCIRRAKRKMDVVGVRKIEVTYNAKEDTFHPHIHGIFSREVCDALLDAWMDIQGDKSSLKGQDVRMANDGDVHELFKYATKLFKVKKGEKGRGVIHFDPISQDEIFRALKNKRTFQSYGMQVEVSDDIDELEAVEVEGLEEDVNTWHWMSSEGTWKNKRGDLLTSSKHKDLYQIVIAGKNWERIRQDYEKTYRIPINEI